MTPQHFEDPDFVRRYVEGPGRFVPGYDVMLRMSAQLLREGAVADARILVLGAGGGLETSAFASLEAGWRFVGVDPAAEMLAAAKARLQADRAAARVEWIQGLIEDAPRGPFDGATCLLTLHFVPDDGSKLRTLKSLRSRMKPGAPFVLTNLCIDLAAPEGAAHLERYRRFALNSGADADDVEATCLRLVNVLKLVSPARDEDLLHEAGFSDIQLFYAGLSWRGWRSSA